MSYEGYTQYLCATGHYWIVEADIDSYIQAMCPHDTQPAVWHNGVDITNGSHDEAGLRIDGYVDLTLKQEYLCTCATCGVKHEAKPPEYYIPPPRGDRDDDPLGTITELSEWGTEP